MKDVAVLRQALAEYSKNDGITDIPPTCQLSSFPDAQEVSQEPTMLQQDQH